MKSVEESASAAARDVTIRACLRGAHLVSWKTHAVERLWLSPLSDCGSQAAVRGGVPVLFPQFGFFGDQVKHGFARTSDWRQVEPVAREGRAALAFEFSSTAETLAQWPYAFSARLDISASPNDLEMVLAVTNTGHEPMAFTTGLHTYFAVADPAASITGLGGYAVWDTVSTAQPQFTDEVADPIRALEPRDIIVHDVETPVVLHDPELGMLTISAQGLPDRVVWNPGPSNGLPDVAAGDEANFVCIEPAAVVPIKLPPGETWEGRQILAVG